MATLDPKWQVPDSYDITERAFALPPPRTASSAQPMLGIFSVRAIEDQATGDGMFSLYAWQTIAGADALAAQTIDRLANTPNLSGIELLMLGHAYVATGAGGGAAFEIAQRARKLLKVPVNAHSLDASLLLATTALPFAAERVRTLLDMLEPELAQGTDEHRAIHALIRAGVDPTTERIDDAFKRFSALDDGFGLAQCALIGHAHEAATTKRPEALREYIEHAIYRYETDGRPEWAARTIVQGLIPLLVEAKADVIDALGRATVFAVQARSAPALELVFASASRLGYATQLRTLSQVDPPAFTKQEAAAAAAAPAADAKPKKTTTKKKSTKKAS